MRRRVVRLMAVLVVCASLSASLPARSVEPTDVRTVIAAPSTSPKTLAPPADDQLVTNEYATYNADWDRSAAVSPDWVANSGSLFAKDGSFWTGRPDSCVPDRYSHDCTNSNFFRVNSRESFGGATRVSVSVRQNRRLLDKDCGERHTCWRGVHIWLRYQNQYDLYYVSIQRADGAMVVKRKVPCGNDNGGTYFEISRLVPHGFVVGEWKRYSVTIETAVGGDVVIRVFDDDADPEAPVVEGVDHGGTNPKWSSSCRTPGRYGGAAYDPIRDAGSIGLRGDFADFSFRTVVVKSGEGACPC